MATALPTKRILTLEAARVALAASEAEALRNQWRVVIAVVDESANNCRFAFLSISQGMGLLQGAVPIEIEGQVLGAVGVSGVKASDDEAIALAGVNALKAAFGW